MNAAVRRTVQILSSQITDGGDRRAPRAERAAAARADRSREVPPGAHEPDAERDPGDGRARQDHRVDRRAPRRRAARMPLDDGAPPPSRRSLVDETELVEVSVRDTGPGHLAEGAAQPVRPVLHHEDAGHGPRARDQPEHRAERRRHRSTCSRSPARARRSPSCCPRRATRSRLPSPSEASLVSSRP